MAEGTWAPEALHDVQDITALRERAVACHTASSENCIARAKESCRLVYRRHKSHATPDSTWRPASPAQANRRRMQIAVMDVRVTRDVSVDYGCEISEPFFGMGE